MGMMGMINAQMARKANASKRTCLMDIDLSMRPIHIFDVGSVLRITCDDVFLNRQNTQDTY